MDTKRCRTCGEHKSAEQMSRSSDGGRCKSCRNAARRAMLQSDPEARERQYRQNREWRQRNVRNRQARRLATYGITIEEYDAMLARQGGRCAICAEECKTGKRLAVDHDHASGSVRGLLCARCNVMIGMALDDPERLRRGIAYLTRES